jgi:hypothetical protein
VKQVILVTDDSIAQAQQALWSTLRVAAEPGGAAALAGLLSRRFQFPDRVPRGGRDQRRKYAVRHFPPMTEPFPQVSRSGTIRLNTGAPSFESLGSAK